eukprot:5509460-Amphidinium_carterae.1
MEDIAFSTVVSLVASMFFVILMTLQPLGQALPRLLSSSQQNSMMFRVTSAMGIVTCVNTSCSAALGPPDPEDLSPCGLGGKEESFGLGS